MGQSQPTENHLPKIGKNLKATTSNISRSNTLPSYPYSMYSVVSASLHLIGWNYFATLPCGRGRETQLYRQCFNKVTLLVASEKIIISSRRQHNNECGSQERCLTNPYLPSYSHKLLCSWLWCAQSTLYTKRYHYTWDPFGLEVTAQRKASQHNITKVLHYTIYVMSCMSPYKIRNVF